MPASLSRRRALKLGAGTAVLGLIAACGPIASPASSPPPPARPAPTSSAQPKRGGTLRIGRSNEPSNLDPHLISPYGVNSTWMVLDRLTAYDDNLQPPPRLAESWELSSDSTQLKLNLRKSVTFHSGRELTSDDVKYNLMRVRDPKVGAAQLLAMS